MKEFKPAIYFLMRFLGIYLGGNILYGIYIEYYTPRPDPITYAVTSQSAQIITAFDEPAQIKVHESKPSIWIFNEAGNVVSVYEGCNGINVIIVFIAFMVAFGGSLKTLIVFSMSGLVLIYILNLGRVILLYETALHYEQYFYYFHKYIFTGILYAVVMMLWALWVVKFQTAKGT